MGKIEQMQAKIAELLQANEAAMTLVNSLTSERDALAAKCESRAVQIETLAKEVDAANDRNAELVEQRDALAAQAEALRSAIEPFATGGVCSAIDREDYSIMRERIKDWHGAIEFKKAQDAYNSTPQQCLRDVKAEAGVKGLRRGVALASGGDISLDSILVKIWSDGYAESLRKGGAE